jgi:hypothetical protein
LKSHCTAPSAARSARRCHCNASPKWRCTKASVSRKTNAYVEGQADFEEIISGEDLTA